MKTTMRRLTTLLLIAASSNEALACATCSLKVDTPETRAASLGILFMIGVLAFVFLGFFAFFAFMITRGRAKSSVDTN